MVRKQIIKKCDICEHDYRNDPTGCIKKCMEFLYD